MSVADASMPAEDELLLDVADAVTRGQEVEWERCARLATSANRHALANLRALSGLFAVRVPHPREAARASRRRRLTRARRLRAAATAAAAGLGWLVVSRLDQRRAVARAAASLARAEGTRAVRRSVNRTVTLGCGSPATLLVPDAESRALDFVDLIATIPPLPRTSAVVHVLETARGAVRVSPDDSTSCFPLLPPEDAAWVAETGTDVVVPILGPGASLLGVLVVGQRFDGRVVRQADLPLLEALGVSAGLILARV